MIPGPMARVLAAAADVDPRQPGAVASAAAALAALAEDTELFAAAIAALPKRRTSATWLHAPDSGPRMALVHRPAGQMSAIHSHHVWVALAPIAGHETHEVFTVRRRAYGHATVTPVSYQTLDPGQSAHLIPPGDIHSHGHLAGTGAAPYTLVLLGGNMLAYRREEYDRDNGTWRRLVPGDEGSQGRPLSKWGA